MPDMNKTSSLPIFVALTVCGLCVPVAAYTYWDLSQPQLSPLPPLVAEPSIIDFGDIQGQNVVRGTSIIKNTTEQPIRILHVIVSCTCNDVTLRQGELLPGKTTELSVDWDIRGRMGNTAASLAIVYVLDDIQQILPVNLQAHVLFHPQEGHSLKESLPLDN